MVVKMNNDANFHIEDLLDKYGKFSLKFSPTNHIYLPSLSSIASKLGISTKFIDISKFVEKTYGENLGISKSSKYHVSDKSVSINITRTIADWYQKSRPKSHQEVITFKKELSKIPTPVLSLIVRTQDIDPVPIEWLVAIHGLSISMKKHQELEIYNLLLSFILLRIESYCEYLLSSVEVDSIQITNVNDISVGTLLDYKLWTQHSQAPTAQLDLISYILKDSHNSSDLSNFKIQSLHLANLYKIFDFHLHFIAHYEVCLLNIMIDTPPSKSILARSIKEYSTYSDPIENKFKRTLFGAMLKVLTEELSTGEKINNSDGWRKLASFIDIKSKGSVEPLNDRQYEQIKDWRIGKNLPSQDKLEIFVDNYCNHADRLDMITIMNYFKLINLLEEQGAEVLSTSGAEDATRIEIKKVLSRYPIYYKKCLEDNLKNQSPKQSHST